MTHHALSIHLPAGTIRAYYERGELPAHACQHVIRRALDLERAREGAQVPLILHETLRLREAG